MSDLCKLVWCALCGLFRPRAALQAEILVLRHQLNVPRRKSPKRAAFSNIDRLVFAGLCRLGPGVLDALKILRPETVIRWHRAGFRAYWLKQNQGIIACDACHASPAWDVGRQPIQVSPPARSREPFPSTSAQYCCRAARAAGVVVAAITVTFRRIRSAAS
jgi:hypothetical protein